MYQGHKTKDAYIAAWKAHVRDLVWMWAETMPISEADAKRDSVHADIHAAADKLEREGRWS